MVRIPPDERLQVYVSVCNIEPSTYRSRVLLTNHRGEKLETKLTALGARIERVP